MTSKFDIRAFEGCQDTARGVSAIFKHHYTKIKHLPESGYTRILTGFGFKGVNHG